MNSDADEVNSGTHEANAEVLPSSEPALASPVDVEPPLERSLSVLSVSSSESTEKLIKSLSMGRLDGSPQPQVLLSPLQQLPKNDTPKPIKFTVRKVSRETIPIPDLNVPKRGHVREYAYGNLPENREKLHEGKLTDKPLPLQHSQEKYDQYSNRIQKITKEIDFLTNLLPPYNVEIDYVTRTKITKAIEKLRMKQDEIEKKKYSLGISISRMWREHNENDIFVRSVSKH